MMPYYYNTPKNATPKFSAWSNRIAWCQDNCKKGTWQYESLGKFIFYDEKDYILFLLRWHDV